MAKGKKCLLAINPELELAKIRKALKAVNDARNGLTEINEAMIELYIDSNDNVSVLQRRLQNIGTRFVNIWRNLRDRL